MVETVKFDPAHIAGYGQLADETGDHAFKIGIFVSNHATSDDGFSGLMTFCEAEVAARDWAEQQVARRAADARRDDEPVFTSAFEEPAPLAPSTMRPRRPSGDDDDEDFSEYAYLGR